MLFLRFIRNSTKMIDDTREFSYIHTMPSLGAPLSHITVLTLVANHWQINYY